MQLTVNRYFAHKYFHSIIRTVMRKGHNDNMLHLYVDLVEGDEIKGVGSHTFMLATSLRQDQWPEILADFVRSNLYVDHQPFRMSMSEASSFIAKCHSMKSSGLRLGQAMLNLLGDKTPTPNSVIFGTTDDQVATDWFYANHVDVAASEES